MNLPTKVTTYFLIGILILLSLPSAAVWHCPGMNQSTIAKMNCCDTSQREGLRFESVGCCKITKSTPPPIQNINPSQVVENFIKQLKDGAKLFEYAKLLDYDEHVKSRSGHYDRFKLRPPTTELKIFKLVSSYLI